MPLGNYGVLYPPACGERAAAYEVLLQAADRIFETRSVWFKAQTTVQDLQVLLVFSAPSSNHYSSKVCIYYV